MCAYIRCMDDRDFELALIDAAFALGAERGWSNVSPAAAARHAGLDLAQARSLFSCNGAILRRFGRQADAYALTNPVTDGSIKDRLFDILLRRFDYLQIHRAGVVALTRHLPVCPPLAVALAEMNIASMGWLLEGAGVDATGFMGALKKRGLLGVWLYALRVWLTDDSPDLTATMAAVDTALAKVEGLASKLGGGAAVAEKADTTKNVSKN